MTTVFALKIFTSVLAIITFSAILYHLEFYGSFMAYSRNKQRLQPLSHSNHQQNSSFPHMYGWEVIGHTSDEQTRLRDLSAVVAAWPMHTEDNVPTVPCLSADGHLLLLSVAASRVRYGTSITFTMVYPTNVKNVLPRTTLSQPLSAHALSL
jgi:hypothetical protein